jgi:hypothetical protein
MARVVQYAIRRFIYETISYKKEIFMADKQTQQKANESNTIKDPENWTTGDEPMTGAQRSYLSTLSEEAHEEFDENLTKAEASKRIEELQEKTGRGQSQSE